MKKQCIICNQCGKIIAQDQDRADWLHVEKNWGYFSGKDGEIHSFDLCEACYERLIKGFRHPVTVSDQKEYL